MKLAFLVIGKTVDRHLQELQEEYQKRINFYAPFDYICLPELKNTKNISEGEQKEKEGELLLKQITTGDYVILLDERGKELRSIEFARYMGIKMQISCKRLLFVIGGPYGFSEAMYARADDKLSLSRMTFSHQMVRLIFQEQLYRAMTILKGEPYHHE